jgi:hypothetical protein
VQHTLYLFLAKIPFESKGKVSGVGVVSAHGVVPAPRDETAIRELDEMLRRASEHESAGDETRLNGPGTNRLAIQHRDDSPSET